MWLRLVVLVISCASAWVCVWSQMKLEYTTLHNEFVQFFEEKVEKVIASVGGSPSEFYQQLKKRVRLDATGADAQFTQVRSFPSHVVHTFTIVANLKLEIFLLRVIVALLRSCVKRSCFPPAHACLRRISIFH